MDKALILMQMEANIAESGKMINKMDMGLKLGLMAVNMKVNISWEINMAMVYEI